MLHSLVDQASVSEIQTADISNGAVTDEKIASGAAINLSKIGENGIGGGKKLYWNASNDNVLSCSAGSDEAWTERDLSSYVSSDTTAVYLRGRIRDGSHGAYIAFRAKGSSSSGAAHRIYKGFDGDEWCYSDLWVECDSNQVIEYMTNASGPGTLSYDIYLCASMEDF
jgi:hypothetical protein